MKNMECSPAGIESSLPRVLEELAEEISGLLMVALMTLGTQGI